MAVQNPEAQRGDHEEPGAGGGDPGQFDRPFVTVAAPTADGDQPDQGAGEDDREHDEQADQRGEVSEDAGRQPMTVLLAILLDQPGEDGDEAGGDRAFAEKVLDHVRHPHRGPERVG